MWIISDALLRECENLPCSRERGGGILGGHLLGWRTVCAVERDRYAASILAQRQNDGALYPFPIWNDVCTFDGFPWRGIVDVVSGGFPCQDISVAGSGAGLSGERSGLWREFARIIREVLPRFVFVENSPALVTRGLDTVLGDLAAMGFNAEWGVFGADDVGAPHRRKRIWIVGMANAVSKRRGPDGAESEGRARETETCNVGCGAGEMANADRLRQQQSQGSEPDERGRVGDGGEKSDASNAESGGREADGLPVGTGPKRPGLAVGGGDPWRAGDPGSVNRGTQPAVGRMANGVAHRVDRLRAIGNGQVPLVAAIAFSELHKRLNK